MKTSRISLLFTFCFLLSSCTVDYPCHSVATFKMEYINDTDYECSIEWRDSNDNGSSIIISSQDSYEQKMFVGEGSSHVCNDGKIAIVNAKSAELNFAGSGCKTYAIPKDFGWFNLPSTEEILDIPYVTTYKFYLSDILSLMQRADTTE